MHLNTQPKSQPTAGSPTTEERLNEIADLLAAGLLRLHLRQAEAAIAQAKKNSPAKREKQLDAGARKSVHASRTRV